MGISNLAKIKIVLNEENPSPYLLSMMKDSENEFKKGDYYEFNNNQEALDFLA